MDQALKIVELLNAATPGIATLVMIIRRKDGTVTVAALLDEADAKFDDNINKAREWLSAH
jgi:hypothetical protein